MSERLLTDYFFVSMFSLIGVVVVIGMIGISRILQPRRQTPELLSTYECGEEPIGNPWVQFRIRYYVFALLFVIFDIETVFLYPWAVVFNKLGLLALVEMAVFIIVLLVGLLYAWKKGALKWV